MTSDKTKIPEFNSIEELRQWLEEQAMLRKPSSKNEKKDWIPVERRVFVDYFNLPDIVEEDS